MHSKLLFESLIEAVCTTMFDEIILASSSQKDCYIFKEVVLETFQQFDRSLISQYRQFLPGILYANVVFVVPLTRKHLTAHNFVHFKRLSSFLQSNVLFYFMRVESFFMYTKINSSPGLKYMLQTIMRQHFRTSIGKAYRPHF